MKAKLIKTFLVIILLVVVTLSYNTVSYGVNQEYSKTATEQVNDDSAYYTLKTKKASNSTITVIYVFTLISSLSLFAIIWKPKKTTEKQEQ